MCLSRDRTSYEQRDVTDSAIEVIKMIRSLDRRDRVTANLAAEIWRGANRANVRPFAGNDYYGAGKDWERGDAERLIQHLLFDKGLAEFSVANKAGWSNSYLSVSAGSCSLCGCECECMANDTDWTCRGGVYSRQEENDYGV